MGASGGSGERGAGPVAWARTGLALGSAVTSLATGLAVMALSGDRQRGANAALSLFGDLATAACGIELDLRGVAHVEAARPAVFVFNHQSQVDILVMASLLRRDVGFVAKREVRRHPIMGPAGAFIGTVFIDRSDRASAVAALRPAVDALRAGHSIAIAPEGTRSRDGTLGPFKKGAFHMARAAGVPVVPVVIHDAWRAMPRGAWTVRPARVRVDVLEPVPTSGWRADALDAHVHEVRARFLAALGQESGD